MKLLVFTSPIGLGHATRDIAICEKLGSLTKGEILFVTGQSAHDIISKKGYFAYDVYTPNIFNVDDLMQLKSIKKWLLQYFLYYRKCKAIAKEIIEKNDNNNALIVSDEDLGSIAIAEKKKIRRIIITDLLQTHFLKGLPSIIEYGMNRFMKNMIKNCDRVIIPDDEDSRYSYTHKNMANISYVGPIVRELTTIDRAALRKRFGMNKKTILVSIGGTSAGRYLIEMTIKAFEKLKRKLDIDLMIASGPSLPKIDNCGRTFHAHTTTTTTTTTATPNIITTNNVRNIGFVDNLHEYIFASDLLISLAGRSTIDESIAYGTPGIFIPIKDHFEQEQNAQKMGYRYQDIFRLESLINEKVTTACTVDRQNKINSSKNGAERAAKIILEILQ